MEGTFMEGPIPSTISNLKNLTALCEHLPFCSQSVYISLMSLPNNSNCNSRMTGTKIHPEFLLQEDI